MRVAITGAAGGIGSVLADRLFELGIETTLIDDLSKGSITNFDYPENRKKLIEADIRNEEELLKHLHGVEVIVHLAAISSLAECQLNPSLAFSVNVEGTAIIAKLASLLGANVIFASTSAVYENNLNPPFSENSPVDPNLVYSLTKFCGERIFASWHTNYNLQYLTLRLFNVFGPRQDYKRISPPLINYLVREIYFNRIPSIHAPLSQGRDYVYVGDVVELIEKIILNKKYFLNAIFNVCSGKEITINQIIDSISKGFGQRIKFAQKSEESLWEDYGISSGKFPLNSEVVKKEVLKKSIGNPKLTSLLLDWSANSSVLDKIVQDLKTMTNSLDNNEFL
jgi:UDP-glucose 4-epimerase